jgi:hypothetical protein
VRDSQWLPLVSACWLCLGFTGGGVAWGDEDHGDWVDDPYAPHVTRGTTARLGTMVGFLYGEQVDALGLGLTGAVGQRWGRLALDAEYTYLGLSEIGPSSTKLGEAHRLGVISRFDVIRLGSRWVGGNSLLAIYAEGGAMVAWNRWDRPGYNEAQRVIPADTKRPEAQLGFGVQIDHRLQKPIGFPHRIGWFLGWRMALSPHASEPPLLCRGQEIGMTCRAAPATSEDRFVERSLLFQSSLSATW